MSNARLENLKLIAEEISSTSSQEKQISLLTKGFELFSEETGRLEKAYAELKEMFRLVNMKLEETNESLGNKVKELHVLTEYLDSILSHMSQGLIFIDLEGHITTYNKSSEAIFEKDRAHVLFQQFKDSFPDNLFGFSMEQALKTQQIPRTSIFTLHFPDGRSKDLEVEMSFIPKKEEGVELLDYTQGLIILTRDITEFRKLQTIASRKDRMQALGEMAAQVAHEIRNPLGGIKGFSALLQRDLKNQPEQLRLTEYIVNGANTLDRLVTQVLNYTRPANVELQQVNLSDLISELKQSLEGQQAIDPKIDFRTHMPKELTTLADPGLLKSALRNLVINALQAMPDGGALTVTLKEEEKKAIITVKDTGVGIPEEHMKKLFSPFFSTKADGNGLGLAESHKVIQAHGGEIAAESSPGKGTIFTLKIPIKV